MTYPPSNPHLLIIILAFALLGAHSATADEFTDEHIRLTTVLRELNSIDRITALVTARDQGTSRYHFNYARLSEDIHRVSAGLQQYLSPQRATPRDDTKLHGNYRDEADAYQ